MNRNKASSKHRYRQAKGFQRCHQSLASHQFFSCVWNVLSRSCNFSGDNDPLSFSFFYLSPCFRRDFMWVKAAICTQLLRDLGHQLHSLIFIQLYWIKFVSLVTLMNQQKIADAWARIGQCRCWWLCVYLATGQTISFWSGPSKGWLAKHPRINNASEN